MTFSIEHVEVEVANYETLIAEVPVIQLFSRKVKRIQEICWFMLCSVAGEKKEPPILTAFYVNANSFEIRSFKSFSSKSSNAVFDIYSLRHRKCGVRGFIQRVNKYRLLHGW